MAELASDVLVIGAGLIVTDGSAFVSAAAVNPTNTLQAVAPRAADRVARTPRTRDA